MVMPNNSAQVIQFADFKKSRQPTEAAVFCDNRTLNQCIEALSDRVFNQWYDSVRIDCPVDEHQAGVTESIIDQIRFTFSISTDQIHTMLEASFNIRMTQYESDQTTSMNA